MTDEGHTERLEAALDGKYRIERKLGEGAMASVYLAEDIEPSLRLEIPRTVSVRGCVQNQEGSPVSGVYVVADDGQPTTLPWTRTDAKGRFVLRLAEGRQYRLKARPTVETPDSPPGFRIDAGSTLTADVSCLATDRMVEVVLHLEREF